MTHTTRNTRGARKMADNGQTLPYWMIQQHSLDSLNFFPVFLLEVKQLRAQGVNVLKYRKSIFSTCRLTKCNLQTQLSIYIVARTALSRTRAMILFVRKQSIRRVPTVYRSMSKGKRNERHSLH